MWTAGLPSARFGSGNFQPLKRGVPIYRIHRIYRIYLTYLIYRAYLFPLVAGRGCRGGPLGRRAANFGPTHTGLRGKKR